MPIDKTLPLIDLHRHLDGNVRVQTIIDLSRKHNLELPAWEVESLRPYTQVIDPKPNIAAFFTKFQYLTRVLVDYEACRRVAYENVEDAMIERIDYIELRFSPWFMAETHHLNPEGVVEAVLDGIAAGSHDFKVKTNMIGILSRTYGPEVAWQELQAILSKRDQIIALDLAGLEAEYPGSLFVKHFQAARDAGLKITVHAGEAAGADFVWQAINELGAQRIGHGVRSIDDPALLNLLTDRGIGIESNLTSNVQTSVVPNYQSHPLKHFLERGILATINTDDPGISGIDLPYEYEIAAPAAGLSQIQIQQAQKNALQIAFLSSAERNSLIELKQMITN
jgi:adenosine deaminase